MGQQSKNPTPTVRANEVLLSCLGRNCDGRLAKAAEGRRTPGRCREAG
jgi:hypothetical protein